MHETVFASSILHIVEEEVARHAPGCAVEEIILHIGRLACLEETTLKGCFEIMSEDTLAKDASLIIKWLPLRGVCPDCGSIETTDKKFACPVCGVANVNWHGGNEMDIASIKVRPI
jgi:hydrogenase nickel incorporation protein HypA/HybF